MKKILITVFILLSASLSFAQAIVFTGTPSVKVIEAGVEHVVTELDRVAAVGLSCVITEQNGNFYWKSRGNKQMLKRDAGAFVTFIAVDGAGYVRIIKPDFKEAVVIAMTQTEKKFDYVEHLTTGLRSVIYYGGRF